MNNQKTEIEKPIQETEQTGSNDLSKRPVKSELDKFNEVYKNNVQQKLAALRSMKFQGKAEDACVVEMTSQYTVTELNIDPHALLRIFNESQVDTQNIEIDQLANICVALGELARVAFNDAKDKARTGSEKVFNNLMEEMQNELFDTSK